MAQLNSYQVVIGFSTTPAHVCIQGDYGGKGAAKVGARNCLFELKQLVRCNHWAIRHLHDRKRGKTSATYATQCQSLTTCNSCPMPLRSRLAQCVKIRLGSMTTKRGPGNASMNGAQQSIFPIAPRLSLVLASAVVGSLLPSRCHKLPIGCSGFWLCR